MKVFFVMSTDAYSGAEAVNFSIMNALKDKYEFYWVSRKGKINEYLEEEKINFVEIDRLNVKEINRVIREYKPDILHATDHKASVICSLAKRGGVPFISHLHNNSPWLSTIHPYSFLFLFAALKSKKILTVSPSIEKEYIFSKLIKSKIMMIGNPVSRMKILKKVDIANIKKEYDICCVARITPQKNIYKFIDVIKKVKKEKADIKAVWVGAGEQEKELRKLIDENNLNNNISLVGFQKNPYQFMAKSKIFLLTSDWEGFGLVAFEALTLGLPCAVSNVGGLTGIVDDNCGKLCSNIEDYYSEIIELLDDREIYNRKSNKAIIKSLKIDNTIDYMEKMKGIYNELIKD